MASPAKKDQQETNKISIYQLKKMCKENKIKGYSKKKKNELVELLLATCDTKEVKRAVFLAKTVKELKQRCKELKIKGYSKKRKIDLVNIIQQKEKENEELIKAIDTKYDATEKEEYLSTKDIIKRCYNCPKIGDIKLDEIIQYFTQQEEQTIKDIVKTMTKKIRKWKEKESEKKKEIKNAEKHTKPAPKPASKKSTRKK